MERRCSMERRTAAAACGGAASAAVNRRGGLCQPYLKQPGSNRTTSWHVFSRAGLLLRARLFLAVRACSNGMAPDPSRAARTRTYRMQRRHLWLTQSTCRVKSAPDHLLIIHARFCFEARQQPLLAGFLKCATQFNERKM